MNGDDLPLRNLRGADVVAIVMARTLADGGFEAQLRLVRGEEWHLTAGDGDGRLSFGFRCSMADLLRDPQGYAEYHARKMCIELFLGTQERP